MRTTTTPWPRVRRRPPTIAELKRRIAGDSIERKRDLDKLVQLVRADERSKLQQ